MFKGCHDGLSQAGRWSCGQRISIGRAEGDHLIGILEMKTNDNILLL